MGGYVAEAVGTVNGRPGEWAGKVIPPRELGALLARFGMIVGLDTSPQADEELQSAQMAHALLGAAEAHATRAEQAYRDAGAEPPDITQASLMAFAAVNCQNEADELALISWRATRLAGVLGALDFSGPIAVTGEVGSGDSTDPHHAPGRGRPVRDGHRRPRLDQSTARNRRGRRSRSSPGQSDERPGTSRHRRPPTPGHQ